MRVARSRRPALIPHAREMAESGSTRVHAARERMNKLYLAFYFQIRDIEYKIQRAENKAVKYIKRNRNKLIIESINIAKDIVLHSRYILLIRA